ncbi:protein of unknown function (plasmid) [Cupriavidus taiwanensis]|uniref:Uncharacterized protein n=1 Tax=Cupriavidus taiwanensis TaxID=164546 RepID=A0A375IM41_9BURK|nr:protein of unknown function [Cupriavidus taiwanensis]
MLARELQAELFAQTLAQAFVHIPKLRLRLSIQ